LQYEGEIQEDGIILFIKNDSTSYSNCDFFILIN
jgi:hypothetical protein